MRKYARFVDRHTIDLEGERLALKTAIIATGSSPVISERKSLKTTLSILTVSLSLKTCPKSWVIGLGVMGIELGQALIDWELVYGFGGQSIAGVSDPVLKDYVVKKFVKR